MCRRLITAKWPEIRVLEAETRHVIFERGTDSIPVKVSGTDVADSSSISVVAKFASAWLYSGTAPLPQAKQIFTVVRTAAFFDAFDAYKYVP